MKILVLDEEFPFPLNSGKRIRSFQIWSRIARHCEVVYVAYGTAESESAARLRGAGITTVPVDHQIPAQRGPGFYLRLFNSIFSRNPFSVDRHFSRAFLSTCLAARVKHRPDLLVCEWTPYAQYARYMPDQRTAVVAHGVESVLWSRYAEHAPWGPKRWYLGLQCKRMERFERQAANAADGVITVSDNEGAQMKQWAPKTSVITVDNGVDISYFVPSPAPDEASRLVFSGAMDWRPNQHAVRYFVHDVLPIIRRTHADIRFTIVGRNPSRDVLSLASMPGVEVTGTVDDIRPYLAGAAVFVVPLLIAGGSRLKILEALAMSRPVVSTSVGAEGLNLVDGTHFLRADDAASFAHQVCRLISDGGLRSALARQGRRLVEQHYDWEGLAQKQLQFMTALCRGS